MYLAYFFTEIEKEIAALHLNGQPKTCTSLWNIF